MNDTSPEMRQKQFEIMLAMPPARRFMYGIDMIDFTRNIIENRVKSLNPGMSQLELRIEVVKKYYKSEFSQKEMANIIESFRRNGES